MADVKFLDFNKIDRFGRYDSQKRFLLENLVYYDHWSPGWIYEVSKDSLIRGLKYCLKVYALTSDDVFERDLLLGEIAHYLYNLSQETYYDTAEAWYLQAIRINNKDCRGYWFLGYAYATSDRIAQGIKCFQQALPLVIAETGVDFWQEYAFAMNVGNMPFHARFGLSRYLQNGGQSSHSKIMDSTLRTNLKQADPDIRYSAEAMWESSKHHGRVTFASFPLGIKFSVDSNWNLSIGGFEGRTTGFSIKPPVARSAKGNEIGYTIGMVARVAGPGEGLEDFIASLTGKMRGSRDSVFRFARTFRSGISYSYNDSKIYADRGGARVLYFGVEREFPKDAGLALEDAAKCLAGGK